MKLIFSKLEGMDYQFSIDKPFGRSLTSEDTDLNLEEFSDFIISILRADAKRTLPPNTAFEIRGAIPTDFGRNKSYCWLYDPKFERELKGNAISPNSKWTSAYHQGVLKAGRFLT